MFQGTARLFPLPNLVLFPHVIQPLHVFEPRYRQLTEDALADDRLLAIALLRPGYEEDYHKAPPVHPVICLGRITAEERLPDGRYYLLLHGTRRARIIEEVPTDRLYRAARVVLLDDVPASADRSAELRQQFARTLAKCGSFPAEPREQLEKLLQSDLELGALSDVLAFALPLDVACKQELLEELRVEHRMQALVQHLHALVQHLQDLPGLAQGRYPPDFSDN
jgi:Lon protease-like protein